MFEGIGLFAVVLGAVMLGAVLSILHALASTIRNTTAVWDLRSEVAAARYRYQLQLLRIMSGEDDEVIEVDVIEDEPGVDPVDVVPAPDTAEDPIEEPALASAA